MTYTSPDELTAMCRAVPTWSAKTVAQNPDGSVMPPLFASQSGPAVVESVGGSDPFDVALSVLAPHAPATKKNANSPRRADKIWDIDSRMGISRRNS
jgi:hypothetical protein